MIRSELIGKDTGKIRDSLHKMRDVQSSLNKESKNEVKLYPGRKPSEIKTTVAKKRSKAVAKGSDRTPFGELLHEEAVRNATEKVKEAMLRDKADASPKSINKANSELSKAIIRSRC